VNLLKNVSYLSLSLLNMGGGTPESARLPWPLALLVSAGVIVVAPIVSLIVVAAISSGGNVVCCPSENFELLSL